MSSNPPKTRAKTNIGTSGIVTCDHVHRDRATGKTTLLGCFNNLKAINFPTIYPEFFVWCPIWSVDSGGKANFSMTIELEEHRIAEIQAAVEFPAGRRILEQVFKLQNFSFQKPGDYWIRLKDNEITISEKIIIVSKGRKK